MPQFPSPGQNFPTFAISDGISGGVFLVDATATTNAVSQADLAAQATATMNVIALVQTATASQPMGTLARPMAGLSFPPGDGGSGSGTGYTNSIHPFTPNTNALWLGLKGVSNGVASLNLYAPTNTVITSVSNVYAIRFTTNLLSGWQVTEEVRLPYPLPRTNLIVVSFLLPTLDQNILFVRGMSWTGVTHGGNIVNDWWFWLFYGVTDLSDTNVDCQGRTLVYDYTNNLVPTGPLVITQQPASQMVLAGDTAVFDVAVEESGNYTSQWLFNGSPVINSIISTAAGTGIQNYSGDGGAATNASLHSPSGIAVDGVGNLFIADTGNNLIRKVSYVNFTSGTNQSSTLTIPDVQTNEAGDYQLVIANACGSATSSVATLIVGVEPVITREPVSQFLILGDNAEFAVTATGIPTPGYQWYFDSTAMAGANQCGPGLDEYCDQQPRVCGFRTGSGWRGRVIPHGNCPPRFPILRKKRQIHGCEYQIGGDAGQLPNIPGL